MTGCAASCCSHRSREARRCSTNSTEPSWPSTGPFFSGRGGMKYPLSVCFSNEDSACNSDGAIADAGQSINPVLRR